MRSAYEPPPWLAPLNTPSVASVLGLGTGGGAAVQTPDSGGFGDVILRPGIGYNQAGSVSLQFPSTPPSLFISADQAFGPVTQATVGDVVIISWTQASFPAPDRFEGYKLHYEWSSSS